jgi:hypothetical protein
MSHGWASLRAARNDISAPCSNLLRGTDCSRKVFEPLSTLTIHTSELDADPSIWMVADRQSLHPQLVVVYKKANCEGGTCLEWHGWVEVATARAYVFDCSPDRESLTRFMQFRFNIALQTLLPAILSGRPTVYISFLDH